MNDHQADRWREASNEAAKEAKRLASAGKGTTTAEAQERFRQRQNGIARRHGGPTTPKEASER